MKIFFIIGNLKGGGAERVLTLVAEELAKRNNEVIISTYSPDSNYVISPKIKKINIFEENEMQQSFVYKLKRRGTFFIRLYKILKKEKPDIIISFMKGMNRKVIPISKLLDIPLIVSEHTNHKAGMNYSTWFERRWMYKIADSVTVLTKYDYENYYNNFLNNVVIMPNPVTFKSIKLVEKRNKILFAAGSLNRWKNKGFDNLLIIFSKISNKYPDWLLKIAGNGSDGEKYLKNLAKELKIEKKVIFLGFCQDISKELKNASLFILTSKSEGFPMVLIESMSQGCTTISYNCISGPNEIITNGIDGILVENQNMEEMEKEISKLIEDEELRNYLAKNAIKNIERYSIQNIGNQWMTLVNKTINRKNHV